MSLEQVNIADPVLTVTEAFALKNMLEKRESYVDQGRSREAHGLGTGIMILWRSIKAIEQSKTTDFGALT